MAWLEVFRQKGGVWHRLGRKVVWNPSAEQSVDDEQANRMLRRVPRPPRHV